MKKILLAILMAASARAAVGAGPAANPGATDTLFLKAGAGSYGGRWYFIDYYNRQNGANGILSLVDLAYEPGGWMGSWAVGLDCPDRFSYFISGEWLANDEGYLLNAEYHLANSNPVDPYAYFGLGFDVSTNGAIGGCGQFGLGADFPLTKNFGLFAETKVYAGFGVWTTPSVPAKDLDQWDLYWPVLAGVKLKL
jgi:hypothetical protein